MVLAVVALVCLWARPEIVRLNRFLAVVVNAYGLRADGALSRMLIAGTALGIAFAVDA